MFTVASFSAVNGLPALHENDGKLGFDVSSGVLNGFGPELRGTTSEPAFTRFAYRSHTEQSLVIRIESALTCEPSSVVMRWFAQMSIMKLLSVGSPSIPPRPSSILLRW